MTETMTIAEYREMRSENKYRNRRAVRDGVEFDSQAEATRYGELKLLVQAGAISDLRLQPSYELQAAFVDTSGVKHRAIAYIGDFEYIEAGRVVCEDVKGMRTPVFLLKMKLFKFRYPHIDFRLVEV